MSYLKAIKLVTMGCIYHLVTQVYKTNVKTPPVHSIPFVSEFSYDLLGFPPEREIDFGIDIS